LGLAPPRNSGSHEGLGWDPDLENVIVLSWWALESWERAGHTQHIRYQFSKSQVTFRCPAPFATLSSRRADRLPLWATVDSILAFFEGHVGRIPLIIQAKLHESVERKTILEGLEHTKIIVLSN